MNTNFLAFLFGLIIAFHGHLEAKIRLLTFHCNKPEFIELQHKSLQKFMKDDYELIVFNDARLPENVEAINTTCARLGILCVRYEQHWHKLEPFNEQLMKWLADSSLVHSHVGFKSIDIPGVSNQPSVRHCHVIQYALDNFGYDHDDIVAIMDGDIFPIRPFDLRALLNDSDIIGIRRCIYAEDIDYLWVPFIAFDPKSLPHIKDLKFHLARIGGYIHDTGAQTYHYLKNNPQVKAVKYDYHGSTCFFEMPPSEMKLHGFNDNEISLVKTLPWPQCVEFHLGHHLLHFGASSFMLEGHDAKSECVKAFIDTIIEGN